MAANFPATSPSFSNPTGSDYLNSPAHATQHSSANDEITAVAAKIGTGASTPVVNAYMKGSGTGTSAWTTIPAQNAWVTATYGATSTLDLSAGPKQRLTLTGDTTLALSNVLPGHVFIIELIQDASGGHTPTFFGTIVWPGGVAPTVTETASKADIYGFVQTSTDNFIGTIVGQNI
ncbi:hypothetical protein M0R04_10650 [Candidatus Dojkabacteria bacterium]|jgi:hypothetical protein|nr:hypothetical protein [Candidatus Dojkabacteria bacterium]